MSGPTKAPWPGAAKAATGPWTAEAAARTRRATPKPPGRGPLKPPGPPAGRKPPPAPPASRGRASLTESERPMNGCWLNRLMASSAIGRSRYSTKAKPRGRPVSRSTGITIWEGGPTPEKCARKSASVAPYGILPTNKRTATDYPRELYRREGYSLRGSWVAIESQDNTAGRIGAIGNRKRRRNSVVTWLFWLVGGIARHAHHV